MSFHLSVSALSWPLFAQLHVRGNRVKLDIKRTINQKEETFGQHLRRALFPSLLSLQLHTFPSLKDVAISCFSERYNDELN